MTRVSTRYDVAIIGGGINGASAAQHLSSAGYQVFLAEKDDFAEGATARSSRLLHCGLRHLANGASPGDLLKHPVRLFQSLKTVREDMAARDELVESIPGRLKPMTFCLPIYKQDIYRPWNMDIAFGLLRLASPGGVALDYRRFQPNADDMPSLARHLRNGDQLAGMVTFREYIFDWPERIALDALADARRKGAELRNYTKVIRLERENNGWQLILQDKSRVSASVVLNLSGAWVDDVSARAGSNAVAKCQPMSGIHIALKLPIEFEGHGVFAFNRLAEPLYCLPWRDHHYVGLTRRPYSADPTNIAATDDEIDWLLSETNHCFPNLDLKRDDVLYSWAGVNPLTADPAEPLGSREIKIHDHAPDGLPDFFSVTAGPIMTHRRVARRLMERVRNRCEPSRPVSPAIYEAAPLSGDEFIFNAITENPNSLCDLMLRRLGYGWDLDQGRSKALHVAETVAPSLEWSTTRIEQEIDSYAKHVREARRRPSTSRPDQETIG
ncbi:FAD-dependent oxidoreductase [Roseibium album]|uniref:FAD-dependent oxidoreductase n=1 Tax=Roseibium album TaxID=311410 RepID=UPI0024906703|nr:FAD-dependent oxidoreductase [Roseibium album]